MARVVFAPAAETDYEEALAWYAGRSLQAAIGFETAIEVALRTIGDAPERWSLWDDRHRFYVLRRYPFSLIYRVEAEEVQVVAVAHSRRSPTYWQERI